MKEKLMNHYLNLGPRRFVIGTVLLLITLDILSGLYLHLAWEQNGMAEKLILRTIPPQDLAELSAGTVTEMTGLATQSMHFLFFILMINNLFFYLFYLRKKLWAQGYVLVYAFSGAILSFGFLFDGTGMGLGWKIFNGLTVLVYLYLGLGVKYLKNETTHVPEKKGR